MKYYKNNKYLFYLFFFLFVFIGYVNNVNALETVSIADNDYELVCIYDKGAELTIARDGVYLQNSSIKIDSNAQTNFNMFLTESQTNQYSTDGTLTESRHGNILEGNKCPSKLYAYSVPAKYDNSTSGSTSEESDAINYYYSTKLGIENDFGTLTTGMWWWKETISVATRDSSKDANLVSEEAYLHSSKTATICDYESISTEAISSKQSVSIYLYDNITFLEMGTRVTPLNSVSSSCPQSLTDEEIQNDNPNGKYLYVNDPSAQPIGNAGTSSNYYYNDKRFTASGNSSGCASYNGGKQCQKLEYIGSRNGDPISNIAQDVCELLGNNTINLLRDITNILQILVPILVIVLISLDIAKMVMAGNLDEELPKKKKSIIIRLVIMLIFFFLPLITGLIIQLINEAGSSIGINVGDIECFFR